MSGCGAFGDEARRSRDTSAVALGAVDGGLQWCGVPMRSSSIGLIPPKIPPKRVLWDAASDPQSSSPSESCIGMVGGMRSPATGGARGERGSCGRSPPQMPLLPLRRGTSSYVGSRFAFPPEVPFAPSTTLVDIATRARKSPPIRSQTSMQQPTKIQPLMKQINPTLSGCIIIGDASAAASGRALSAAPGISCLMSCMNGGSGGSGGNVGGGRGCGGRTGFGGAGGVGGAGGLSGVGGTGGGGDGFGGGFGGGAGGGEGCGDGGSGGHGGGIGGGDRG